MNFTKNFLKKETIATDEQKIEKLDIEKIKADPTQVRKIFDDDKLQELADSIREHGIQNPLHVVEEGSAYTILTGERRYRAAQLVGLSIVPCIVHREKMDENKKKALQLIENLQRENLTALETASGFDDLRKSGISQREIARSLGISETHVSRGLTIVQKIPDKWLAEIKEKYKTAAFNDLYEIAQTKNPRKRLTLYQRMMEKVGHSVTVEIEEPAKESTTSSEFTNEEYEKIWENIKKYVRKDKAKLHDLITPRKLKFLLEEYKEEDTA